MKDNKDIYFYQNDVLLSTKIDFFYDNLNHNNFEAKLNNEPQYLIDSNTIKFKKIERKLFEFFINF